MGPRRLHATEQKPPKGKSTAAIRKHKKATAPNKCSPTRASRLCSVLRDDLPEANPLESIQSLSNVPKLPGRPSPSRGRKRKRGLEEEEWENRRQGPSPPTDTLVVAAKRLTKQNLKELNRFNCQKEPEAFDNMSGKKRSRSRSSITDVSEDNVTPASASTHKSSYSLSNYRLVNLDRQRMVFEHGHVPQQVQTRLDSIFQSRISEDDKREVISIAKSLCDDFADVLRAACREDDSVELICRAFESMDKKLLGQTFAIRRKADWDPVLKPTVQWRRYGSALPAKAPNDMNSTLNKPSKEQQPYRTPDGSAPTMPPPPSPSKQDVSAVKTPCPDITIGLHHHVVTAKA